MSEALRPLVSHWMDKIKLAFQSKRREFQDDADEAIRFYNGPYDWLYKWRNGASGNGGDWSGGEDELPPPSFKMTLNKVAEVVQIFGPSLYHKNPVRKVNPRTPPLLPPELLGNPQDPMVQMQWQLMQQGMQQFQVRDSGRSILMEKYLNYTPVALNLKTESRWAIEESLIKGGSCLWTEPYRPAGATMNMVGTFFGTIDDLLIDPDAETLNEATWTSRRHVQPHWMVERKFGMPPDTLRSRATLESYGAQSSVASSPDGDWQRRRGETNDLVTYYCIWSRMGLGGRLSGLEGSVLRPLLDAFGDFCYLVVCPEHPYPLNVPKEICDALASDNPLLQQVGVMQAQPYVQWPTPYWTDDAWPFEMMYFHSQPRKVWPISHVKPALGELKFLNWAFSFLAGKVRTACRDFIGIAKSASEELKNAITHGPDYTMIEVDSLHESIDKMVKFLQHPGFNPEIYTVIEGVMVNFERRTGLTELAYGQSEAQMRSAQEAQVKGSATNIRPDDMANKVEDVMTEIARKEAFAARWHLKGTDVAPIFGEIGASWWDQLVTASNPSEIIHSLEYRIEAGSAKKPNKAADLSNANLATQSLFQPFYQYAMATGNVGPVNALVTMWAKANDMDPTAFMLQPPPAPMPAGPGVSPQAKPKGADTNQPAGAQQ